MALMSRAAAGLVATATLMLSGWAMTHRVQAVEGTGPPTVAAQERGILLEVWLDRTTVAIGERLTAHVRVSNVGTAQPRWETNTCGTGPAPTAISLERPEDMGVDWTGNAAIFKDKLITYEWRPEQLVDIEVVDIDEVGCRAWSRIEPFEPGTVAEMVVAWDAVDRPGRPITPGPATLTSTFEVIGADRRGPARPRPAVVASTTVEIIGEVGATTPVTRYVDAALGDDRFRAWVDRQRRPRHWDTFASYWPNGSGDYPPDRRYERATEGAVDIGMFAGDGRRRLVTIDTTTLDVLGGHVEGDATDLRRSEVRDIAQVRGWSLGEAQAYVEASDEVERIASEVSHERPDIFVGSALSATPGEPPSLYVKGPAPGSVRSLVASASMPITIVDEQPYSFGELEQRSLRVHEALMRMGFEQVATGTDLNGAGRIPVEVLSTPGLSADRAAILAGLPAELRSSVDLRVLVEPFVGEDRTR
jgi:hypothetical protein